MILAGQRGDPDARALLVERFSPLIASVASRYRRANGLERNELMQEGVAGLLVALGRFDPARGTPFWAYASWWVRQGMQQLVAKTARPVVLSDRALRHLARVRDARTAHARVHHEWPSSAQLAAATGLPARQVEQLLAIERTPRALVDQHGGERAGSRSHAARNGAVLTDPSAEDAFEQALTRVECERVEPLVGRLDAREQAVLRARFGLDGPERTLRTIARDLDLSAERVRQIEHHALEELRAAVGVA